VVDEPATFSHAVERMSTLADRASWQLVALGTEEG
jgi:hypothetical protein